LKSILAEIRPELVRELLLPPKRYERGERSEAAAALKGGGRGMPEPAKVFENRLHPGDWRVEMEDNDGGSR
jgi:hypothetical protein